MDRKVIVLTPYEWENRTTLADAAQRSYQANHIIKDKQCVIQSLTWHVLNNIKNGNIEGVEQNLLDIDNMCKEIYKLSCQSQAYIGEVGTVIGYKIIREQEAKGYTVELLDSLSAPNMFLMKGEHVTVFPETYDEKTELVEIMEPRHGRKTKVKLDILGGEFMDFQRSGQGEE